MSLNGSIAGTNPEFDSTILEPSILKSFMNALYLIRKNKQHPKEDSVASFMSNSCTPKQISQAIKYARANRLLDGNELALDPKNNGDNRNPAVEDAFDTASFVKDWLLRNLTNHEHGRQLKEIEQDLLALSNGNQCLFANTVEVKVKCRPLILDLMMNGFINQKNDFLIIDTDKKKISQQLNCTNCFGSGSLLDLKNPFVFCIECGKGYHFNCAFSSEIIASRTTTIGWQCKSCRICTICYSDEKLSLIPCLKCERFFHPTCNIANVNGSNDQICHVCSLAINPIDLATLYELNRFNSTLRKSELKRKYKTKRRKKENYIRRRKTTERDITSFVLDNSAHALDNLENLLVSNRFPDITREDIERYRSIQNHVFRQIDRVVGCCDPKQCTPPYIQFGKYEIKSWYSSPFPQEYATVKKLHICEFCLEYRKTTEIMNMHYTKCTARRPPDREIYRNNNLSVFEVDGQNFKYYCQNLCLISKLFLDHKTLYYDVEPFLFYILTLNDQNGCHLVGYFSKEKFSPQKYNVSCITTLPQYQRMGYGRFLIDFSYLLTREEGLTGSPEKPLSLLGKIGYQAYWSSSICAILAKYVDSEFLSIRDISIATGIDPHDVASTLQLLSMIKILPDESAQILYNRHVVDNYLNTTSYVKRIPLDPSKLRWVPYVKSNSHLDSPAIATKQSEIDAN